MILAPFLDAIIDRSSEVSCELFDDLDGAFRSLKVALPDGLLIVGDPLLHSLKTAIANFAWEHWSMCLPGQATS